MDENKITIEKKVDKMNFFKKFWYSITNFDKYMDMTIQGPLKAFIYVIELTFFMCIMILTAIGINSIINNGLQQNLLSGDILKFLIGEEVKVQYIAAIVMFIQYLTVLLTYVVVLAIIGYITSRLIGIKMRYEALYSMASYAITLSTLLYTLYLIVNIFTIFKIKYMAAAFMAIAYIYIVTVIFMLRADIIKKHLELMKIIEEQKKVKQQLENEKEEKQEEEKNENKDTGKEKKDDDQDTESKEEGLLEEDSKDPKGNEV